MESFSEKAIDILRKIPKAYYLPIGLFLFGMICLSIGLMQLFHSSSQSDTQDVFSDEKSVSATQSAFFDIQVDVEGAVVRPGVYSLRANARVKDALVAAGGLSGLADRDIVARNLNLASKLQDGVKIYVPKIGETQVGSSATADGTVLGAQTGLININTASLDQLDSLPGIGAVTAQKIITSRPFSNIDDLLTKKVVTQSVFQKIKEKITVF